MYGSKNGNPLSSREAWSCVFGYRRMVNIKGVVYIVALKSRKNQEYNEVHMPGLRGRNEGFGPLLSTVLQRERAQVLLHDPPELANIVC